MVEFISEVEPLDFVFTGHPVARKYKEKIFFKYIGCADNLFFRSS